MKENGSGDHPDLFQKLNRVLEEPEGEDGNFLHLAYHIAFQQRSGNMQLRVYLGEQLLTRFERYGIHSLSLHRPGTPQSELDPEHRRFAQNLLRFATLNSSEGYFNIPKKQVGFFLSKLGSFRQVFFHDSGNPVRFSDHYLVPVVELDRKKATEVHLRANFKDTETEQSLPFSEVRVYSGRRSLAFHRDTCYSIKQSLVTPLLDDFNDAGELTLYGREAADFIQEYLPTLSKKPEVILPEGYEPPEVRQVKPQPNYQIREDKVRDVLVLTIQFNYDGHDLAPHWNDQDVLVEVAGEGKNYLIRRDTDYESEVLKQFNDQGFHRVGPTLFETGGESALEFVAENLPRLKQDSDVSGEEELGNFKLFGELGLDQINARATGTGIDWLDLNISFNVGGLEISYEVVQALLAQGKKYLPVGDRGFVKLNTEHFAQLEEKLAELDLSVEEGGHLRLRSYHAPYLNETLKVDWSQNDQIGRMIEALRAMEGIPERPLPDHLKSTLREYQHHGFNWMHFLHQYGFHGILADDMGLGKTIQALSYLSDLKKQDGHQPSLILAPTSVVFNWMNEAKKFTPELKTLLLAGPERKVHFDNIADYDLVFTSYALFRRDVGVLTKIPWRSVVLDEAQNIKNYRSKTALLVKELQAKHRWALTGTPLENRLSELWSIYDYLMPGFLGNYPHFKRKYQQPIEVENNPAYLEKLRRRIYPFVLRRLKSEVAQELPPKTEVTNYCEMTAEQTRLYQEMLEASRRQVFNEVEKRGIERSHVSILTALLRLRQICCHPELLGPGFHKKEMISGKMEAFKDLVTEVISEGHRILVFSQFVEMLGLIRTWLDKEKIAYEYLDGRTRRREERIDRFNNDASIPIFLVSLRAGGTGLNLTGADYVVHYDPWWNPAVQDQATDRVHRIGQTKHVFSYKLITKDSVEEKILLLQERKRGLVKGLLSSDSAVGKRLSFEDLEYLFS